MSRGAQSPSWRRTPQMPETIKLHNISLNADVEVEVREGANGLTITKVLSVDVDHSAEAIDDALQAEDWKLLEEAYHGDAEDEEDDVEDMDEDFEDEDNFEDSEDVLLLLFNEEDSEEDEDEEDSEEDEEDSEEDEEDSEDEA